MPHQPRGTLTLRQVRERFPDLGKLSATGLRQRLAGIVYEPTPADLSRWTWAGVKPKLYLESEVRRLAENAPRARQRRGTRRWLGPDDVDITGLLESHPGLGSRQKARRVLERVQQAGRDRRTLLNWLVPEDFQNVLGELAEEVGDARWLGLQPMRWEYVSPRTGERTSEGTGRRYLVLRRSHVGALLQETTDPDDQDALVDRALEILDDVFPALVRARLGLTDPEKVAAKVAELRNAIERQPGRFKDELDEDEFRDLVDSVVGRPTPPRSGDAVAAAPCVHQVGGTPVGHSGAMSTLSLQDLANESNYLKAEVAWFYKKNDGRFRLSNMAGGMPLFWPRPHQPVRATRWEASECLYHAAKFAPDAERRPATGNATEPNLRRRLQATQNARGAKMTQKCAADLVRPDWDEIKVAAMYWVLELKLHANPLTFGDTLRRTGTREIVEISRKDGFWGAREVEPGVLKGRNVLGKLLTHLRDRMDRVLEGEFTYPDGFLL